MIVKPTSAEEYAEIKTVIKDTEPLVNTGIGMKMDVKEKENVHIYTKKLLSQEDSVKIEVGTEVSKEGRVEKEVRKEEGSAEKGLKVKIEVKTGVIEEKEMTEETQEAKEKA